jgi:hypothetical protein
VNLGYGNCVELHRLIANQFIPKPDGKCEIDHIDRDKMNNSLCNLRWISHSVNMRNRTSNNGVKYEYLDSLPDGFVPFTEYRMQTGEIRHFDNLYVNFDDEIPKFITGDSGHQYRCLYEHDRNKYKYVRHQNIQGKITNICFSRIDKSQLISTTTIETTTTTHLDGTTETKTKTVINKYASQPTEDEMEDEDFEMKTDDEK